MSTEEKIVAAKQRTKEGIQEVIGDIQGYLENDDLESAIEHIAILNANVVGLAVFNAVLNDEL